MAAPTWVAAGTKSTRASPSTSSTVDPPAGHAANDLLVINALIFLSATATLTTPSGWTLLSDSGYWDAAFDDRWRSYLFWKLAASSSEASPTLATSASVYCDAQMYAFRGVNTSTPINANGGWGTLVYAANSSPPTPAVTTTVADCLLVYAGQDKSNTSWATPPSGATEQVEGAQNIAKLIVATETKAAAGTEAADTYARTSAPGSSGARCATFAIAPTAAAVTPVADFSATPTSGVEDLAVTFTDLSSNTPTSWSWTFGDGGTSTVQNPSHTYTTPGTYNVSLVATNAAGSDTETKTGYITVSAAVVTPVADFDASPLSGDTPLAVTFTDESTNTPTSWSWTFGDGGTSTSQNPSHTYTFGGTFTVTLVATNAAGSDTETKTAYITVTVPEIPGVVIAFDDPPLEPNPEWTRIDTLAGCRVRSWTVDTGRPTEFDKTGVGTATVRIVDLDGLFDPTNASSPYNTKVVPNKQAALAIRNPVNDTWHTVYRGFVESWRYVLGRTRQHIEVELQLVDGFAYLSALELIPGEHGNAIPDDDRVAADNVFYENTLAGSVRTRITDILGDAGWPDELALSDDTSIPVTDLDIFSGNVNLSEKVYGPGTSVLAALQDAADGEFPGVAQLYMDRGHVTFHGRQPRFRPAVAEYDIDEYTVGDPSAWESDDTVVPLAEIEWFQSNDSIYNGCRATPEKLNDVPLDPSKAAHNVDDNFVKDEASIDAYGPRFLTLDNLSTRNGLITGTNAIEETRKFAEYYVANYKDPVPRISRLVFKTRKPGSTNADAWWQFVCNVKISDLLTVKTAHPGGGGFDDDFYVEGIHYEVQPLNPSHDHVVVSLDVSPRQHWTTNPFDEDEDPT